jgi:hypothetical protein
MSQWQYALNRTYTEGIICDSEGYTIMRVSVTENTTAQSCLADNVAMMAKAPALLDALRQISLCGSNSASSKEECARIAREAIKGLS